MQSGIESFFLSILRRLFVPQILVKCSTLFITYFTIQFCKLFAVQDILRVQNSSHIESQTLQGCSEIFYEFSFFQLISLPRTSNSVKVIQRTFVHLHSRQASSKSELVHKIIINGIMWHGSLPLGATKFDTFVLK